MAQRGSQALAEYPRIFDLLKIYTAPKAKDLLKTLTLLALE